MALLSGNLVSDEPVLSIAQYTYSTQPRGGVVHTLELAEHLQALGHDVHIYALGRHQQTAFFRPTSVPFTLIPCPDLNADEPLDERIQRYIQTYYEFLATHRYRLPAIHHAQDCISANALWRLREDGIIPSFIRTIHHIEDFVSPALIECQDLSVVRPDRKIVVSRYWQQRFVQEFSIDSEVIYNGVDVARFRPPNELERAEARAKFGLTDQTVLLSIGGIDPRKNSINLLRAFQSVRREIASKGRDVVWVCAGGATLLDYRAYRDSFYEELGETGLKMNKDIFLLGVVPEDLIRQLYWASDILAFPSIKEGWGLVVLEALATGLPVLASDIPVFREYLRNEENALLVDPYDEQSIASGLIRLITDHRLRRLLGTTGPITAERFSWEASAKAHVACYRASKAGAMAARP